MGMLGKFGFSFVMRLVKSVDQSPQYNFGYLERLVIPRSIYHFYTDILKRKREFPVAVVVVLRVKRL